MASDGVMVAQPVPATVYVNVPPPLAVSSCPKSDHRISGSVAEAPDETSTSTSRRAVNPAPELVHCGTTVSNVTTLFVFVTVVEVNDRPVSAPLSAV